MPSLRNALLAPPVVLALTLAAPLAPDSTSRAEAAPPDAPPCADWSRFGNWVSRKAPNSRNPADPFFHTRSHGAMNADLLFRVGMGMPNHAGDRPTAGEYSAALRFVMGQLFGTDLQFLAESNGFGSWQNLVAEQGMGALDGIVDFETTTYSTESSNYCAQVHPVTEGEHAGEFLVVARDKSSGRVIGMAIAGTEDEAKALAEDMVAEAEKEREGNGVVAFPDGCGDVRMPPGFGC